MKLRILIITSAASILAAEVCMCFSWAWALGFTVVGLVVGYFGWNLWNTIETNKMIDVFMKSFPGRCPICAYHRFGLQEGHERPGSRPEEHDCLEREPHADAPASP